MTIPGDQDVPLRTVVFNAYRRRWYGLAIAVASTAIMAYSGIHLANRYVAQATIRWGVSLAVLGGMSSLQPYLYDINKAERVVNEHLLTKWGLNSQCHVIGEEVVVPRLQITCWSEHPDLALQFVGDLANHVLKIRNRFITAGRSRLEDALANLRARLDMTSEADKKLSSMKPDANEQIQLLNMQWTLKRETLDVQERARVVESTLAEIELDTIEDQPKISKRPRGTATLVFLVALLGFLFGGIGSLFLGVADTIVAGRRGNA